MEASRTLIANAYRQTCVGTIIRRPALLGCGATSYSEGVDGRAGGLAIRLPALAPLYIMTMTNFASDPLAWRPVKAPSLAEFEVLAVEVFRHLPKQFRDLCTGVVIQVDDFPTKDVLRALRARSEFDLLGLFKGVGLPFRSESAPVQMPNMIWLYRRPILDYWAEHDETLGAIIQHVLVHEIGHHFGLSDADMHSIERAAN